MYQRWRERLEFLSRGATSLEFPGEPSKGRRRRVSNAVITSSSALPPLPRFLYSPVMVFPARRRGDELAGRAPRSSEKFQRRRHNVIKKYFYVSTRILRERGGKGEKARFLELRLLLVSWGREREGLERKGCNSRNVVYCDWDEERYRIIILVNGVLIRL